jgi:hypothetical protein
VQGGLEPRLLLTAAPHLAAPQVHHHVQELKAKAAHHAQRVAPTAEINAQFAQFVSDFALAEAAYTDAITSQSTNTTTVTATVTQPYTVGSVQLQVDNAAVFGPNGTFTSPLTATASVGGVVVGTFILTGRSGNTLVVNPTESSQVNLNPGVVLTSTVPITSATSAATIFPSFINTRSQELAINLVVYFNGFPIKLPAFNAPPHTPTQRGAMQLYVYEQIANGSPTSLVGSLQAIPLPTTTGSDLILYNQAVLAAIEQSRERVISGVNEIFSGRLKVAAPQPANRLGTLSNTQTTTTTSTAGGPVQAGSNTPGTGS